MIESLESRRLMSASVSVIGTALTVKGGGGNDVLNVREISGAVYVEVDNATTTYDFVGITAININGGGGSDTIFYQGNTVGASVDGSGGKDDSISVDDQGTGSSTVNGGGGNDSITVIHSNDTIVYGGGGKDILSLNTDNTPTGQGNNGVVYAYVSGGAKDTLVDYAHDTYINGSSVDHVQADGTGTAYIFMDKNDILIYAAT